MVYRVTLKPSGHTYEAEEGKTVLQAGLDAGRMMPYSCRAGVCRTCRGTILEGKVDYGLVHETYLRLAGQQEVDWENRHHFFALAAQMMRRQRKEMMPVDYARARQSDKRGGGVVQVSLSQAEGQVNDRAAEVIALDDALSALAKLDVRQSQVIELRYFGGLSVEETAGALEEQKTWNTGSSVLPV